MNENIVNNPFASAGTAVEGSAFVGRQNEIRDISERLFGPEFGNVAIVGIPKVGKSSLMQEALYRRSKELWETKKFIVVWYTLKRPSVENSKEEKRAIFLRLVSDVHHFLENHEESDLIESLEEYYSVIKEHDVIWSEFEQNILYFFEEIVHANIRVIFCIDEFDYSKDLLGESEYELLREISYRNSNKIAIVTTSRRSIYDIEHYTGGGSNFYGTFENIYLKPFNEEEHKLQCELVNGMPYADITNLYTQHGGHPYINAIVLKNYFISKDMSDSIYKTNQDVLRYYNDLFYVLDKDGLADKVDRLYCGLSEDVTETQEDYIYNCYGLFKEADDGSMQPYSTAFESVLRKRYRENPFCLVWPEAERSIRKSITYAMTEEFGDEDLSSWKDEISDFSGLNMAQFKKWEKQMEQEKRQYRARASRNIIDQLYPVDYSFFFKHFWKDYLQNIYGKSIQYWEEKLDFIASKIRNPESHSRKNLIDPEDQQKANIICQEIIDCVRRYKL
jgi:hypothetical protein